ncbi:MAG: efflux RND transporter periplasmic adaptor subunit, partial [Deltaproteobacteria bacterium]
LLASGGAAAFRYVKHRPVATIAVRMHRVERGRVRDLVSTVAAGRVAALREASLRAEIAGTVVHLHHRRGDHVLAGEPLISYDPSELRHRVALAEASVQFGRAQAAQADSSAHLAQSNAARAEQLRVQGVTPPAEAEALSGQADVAAHAAAAARTALGQSGASVQLARDALTHAVLRAPFAGVVLTTTVEEGEVTAPGAPVMTLADTSALHVDAELDEADLGRVQVGMPAEVALDAFPGQRFAGSLSEIAPSVTRDLRGNRSVSVRVGLAPDPRLRVGMSADVDVVVAMRENVLWVPPNAVLGRGTDRAVFAIENSTARRHPIQVGISTWEAVEVTRGVREGDRVIVTLSSADLADGSRVTVRSENAGRGQREGGSP